MADRLHAGLDVCVCVCVRQKALSLSLYLLLAHTTVDTRTESYNHSNASTIPTRSHEHVLFFGQHLAGRTSDGRFRECHQRQTKNAKYQMPYMRIANKVWQELKYPPPSVLPLQRVGAAPSAS